MTYKGDFYQIPTAIDKTIADHIIKNAHIFGGERMQSLIGASGDDGSGAGSMNKKMRNSQQRWMPVDNWIAGMMAHYIHEANRNFFDYDLTGWSDQIQYTEYNGSGSHYGWHCDSNPSLILPGMVRKLSISLLLSGPDEYEGGEFQLMYDGNKQMTTIKPEMGQAIIFPSYAMHRVRPLKSGKRVSLVGWFGGPMYR